MAETTPNTTNGIVENTAHSIQTKRKKRQRTPLPSPIQSNDSRKEINIKGKVSTSPESISSSAFNLYIPFVLSPDSDEIFIKITKNAVVSLATGNKYSSACTGYKVSL